MANPGNFSNNPLYTDITKLDHLSPQPVFSYNWNTGNARWEPSAGGGVGGGSVDIGNLGDLISGLSGALSGVGSNEIDLSDLGELISGLSLNLSQISGINIDLGNDYTLATKTVNQKIEEDFILLENIPDEKRYGTYSGNCYGVDRSIMDDIFNTYFSNGRTNPSTPETGHPDYFIHAEYTDTGRCIESNATFHTDTMFGLRFDNPDASPINSYELKDFSQLYDEGLAENILIFNDSPYPIQFHTLDKTYDFDKLNDPENNNIIYLHANTSVKIESDEARRIYVKRPHTISGFTVKYNIVYRETGNVNTFDR
jgi:hypothetical protein